MSVNSKMTAIADEIRELSGTTGTMGLDAMATNVGEANDEIGTQADVLAQVVAALEGKAAGGGSGGVETCTVTVYAYDFFDHVLYTAYENGEYVPKLTVVTSSTGKLEWDQAITFEVVKNYPLFLIATDSDGTEITCTNAEVLFTTRHETYDAYSICIKIIGDATIESMWRRVE